MFYQGLGGGGFPAAETRSGRCSFQHLAVGNLRS
jgi:hypothetical protein